MDLSKTVITNSIPDDVPMAPIHSDNLPEEDKLLLESEPFSEERAKLLKANVLFHQEKLIEELKEMEQNMETKKQDFWKMEGAKSILDMYIEEECQNQE